MTHLSDVFKYISKFRHAGHQVGRKVGDMLEVLTYAALTQNVDLAKRLHIEPKLFGFSDAGHKVEFALLGTESAKLRKAGEIEDPSNLIGFVECKKVGVEQTIDSSFKKKYKDINYKFKNGDLLETTLGKQGWDEKFKIKIKFLKTNTDFQVEIFVNDESTLISNIANGHRFIFALLGNKKLLVLGNDESLRDTDQTLERCKILEVLNISENHAEILLNACLPGPQTPEKAKQSAFVGLDVRKLRFNHFDKRADETEMVSVLVLTEFSHWETKSQNVVNACLDKVLIVSDAIIVDAFQQFENAFGEDFYDRITKDDFEKNQQVRSIALEIIEKYEGRIFEDLADHKLKKFELVENSLQLL